MTHQEIIKNPKQLINQTYQLLAINKSVIHQFIIKYIKTETIPAKTLDDGSYYKGTTHIYVSNDNHCWFRIYGHDQDNIIPTRIAN